MIARARPLAEVTHDAVRNLINEIGIVDTIRFLNQFSTGYGDYTKERDQLFRDLTLDDVLAAMARERGTKRRPNKGIQRTRKKDARR
jgi:hypothetical protein